VDSCELEERGVTATAAIRSQLPQHWSGTSSCRGAYVI